MAERELGVETLPCETCGTDRPVEEQPDGSIAATRCTKCHTIHERASKSQSREKATDVEEEQK
jgi:hypothetical protein